MLSKTVLRQAFRTNLDRQEDHDPKALARASRDLCVRLLKFLQTQNGVWAGLEPFGFEADIREALVASTHIRWVYPRIEHENKLGFYEVTSRDLLIKSELGIAEPDPARATRVAREELDGLLVPGLAFDEAGNRLGRGRGYYDRALAEIIYTRQAAGPASLGQPLKIGIALDRQIAQQTLPHDSHDIAMDLIITESRTLKSNSERSLS